MVLQRKKKLQQPVIKKQKTLFFKKKIVLYIKKTQIQSIFAAGAFRTRALPELASRR